MAELPEGTVIGIENPLLDISATVPPEFLEKYGLKRGDACLADAKHVPMYGEMVTNYKVDYTAGGATQNVMRACEWMLQKPRVCYFIGCVGHDHNAEILQKAAEKDGVCVKYLRDVETPTGTCAVLIVDRERSLCANLAAANKYKREHLDTPEIQAAVKAAKFFYSSGFFLTVSPESAVHIGQHAAETNKTFFWNIAAPFVCQFFWQKVTDLLPYVDVVFGNELEAAAFGKAAGWGEDIREVAKKLADWPKANKQKSRMVVFTVGKEPAFAYQDGKFTEVAARLIPKEKIVDTNGAGDTFCGGFLSQWIQGKDLKTCMEAGHYAASQVIQVSGVVYHGKPNFPPGVETHEHHHHHHGHGHSHDQPHEHSHSHEHKH